MIWPNTSEVVTIDGDETNINITGSTTPLITLNPVLTGITSINTITDAFSIDSSGNIQTTGTVTASNLPAGTIVVADVTNPALAGYVPFSNDNTGADLVGSYNGASISVSNTNIMSIDNTGNNLKIFANTISIFGNTEIAGDLLIANNSSTSVRLRTDAATPTSYGLIFPVVAPTLGQALITTDNIGTFGWATPASFTTSGAAKTAGTALALNGITGVVVSTTAVTTSSIIMVMKNNGAGTPVLAASTLEVGNIINGASFTIYSTIIGDTDTVNWMIINP